MFQTFEYLYHFFIILFFKPKFYNQKSKNKSDFIPYINSTRKKPDWVIKEIIKIKAIDKNLS